MQLISLKLSVNISCITHYWHLLSYSRYIPTEKSEPLISHNEIELNSFLALQPPALHSLQCTSEQNLRVNLHFCTWHLATCVSSFFVAVLLCTLVSGQWERQTRLVLLRSRLARCCFVSSKKMFASLRGHPIHKKFEIYEPPSPSATFPISNYRADW